MSENIVSHRGVITEITPYMINVSIVAQSACVSCHAKGYCGVSDMQEKVVEVPRSGKDEHKKGDFVIVTMKRSMGLQAVLYGYFIPFLVLIATMFITYELTGDEAITAAFSLGILVPYYFGLYLLKDRLKSAFHFVIEKDQSATNYNFSIKK